MDKSECKLELWTQFSLSIWKWNPFLRLFSYLNLKDQKAVRSIIRLEIAAQWIMNEKIMFNQRFYALSSQLLSFNNKKPYLYSEKKNLVSLEARLRFRQTNSAAVGGIIDTTESNLPIKSTERRNVFD